MTRKRFSPRLPRLSLLGRFRLQVGLALLPLLLLAGWLLAYEYLVWSRANEGVRSLATLRVAFLAIEKASSERGPTNAALGDDLPLSEARLASLRVARQDTDRQIRSLLNSLAPEHCRHCDVDRISIERAQVDLRAARAKVDALLGAPRPARESGAIADAVAHMVRVIPEFLPVVASRTSVVVRGDAESLNCVILARLAADLREYAGLLGSQFTSALAARRPLTEPEQLDIERTLGRIDQLRSMITARIVDHPGLSPESVSALGTDYYVTGRQYAATVRTLASTPAGARISPAEFAANYVPTMRAITDFRDAVLDLGEDELESHRHWWTMVLLVTLTAELVVFGTLLWGAWRFRRHVVLPFVEATRVIEAIAAGDLRASVPDTFRRKEIRDMFDAIRVLKVNSVERSRLERERAHLIGELKTAAETDSLTRLLNRRAFERYARALCSARDTDGQVALVMFDVDHFKAINDTWGHSVGDEALRRVANACRHVVRQGDLVARIGGEEFAVLSRVETAAQADALAERLRARINETSVPLGNGESCDMTASFGIAMTPADANLDLSALFRRADKMLYKAKLAGRNRVQSECDEVAQ